MWACRVWPQKGKGLDCLDVWCNDLDTLLLGVSQQETGSRGGVVGPGQCERVFLLIMMNDGLSI